MNYLEELPKIDLMSDEFRKIMDLGPGQYVVVLRNCTMVLIYKKLYDVYKKDRPAYLSNFFKDCIYLRFRTVHGSRAVYVGQTYDFFERKKEKLPDWEFALVFTMQSNSDISEFKKVITEEKRKYLEAKFIRSFDVSSGYELCNGLKYQNGLPPIDNFHINYLSTRYSFFMDLMYNFTGYGKCFNKDEYVIRKESTIATSLGILEHFRSKWIEDPDPTSDRRERWRGMRAKASQRTFKEAVLYLHGMIRYIFDNGGSVSRSEYICNDMISKSGKKYGREELKCDKETLFKAQDQPYLKFLGLLDTVRCKGATSLVLTPRGEMFAKEPLNINVLMKYVIVALEEWVWAGVSVRQFCREIYNKVGKPNNTNDHIDEFRYIVSHGGVLEYEPYNSVNAIAKLVEAFRGLSPKDREKFCIDTTNKMAERVNNDVSKLRNEQGDKIESYDDVYDYEFLEDHSELLNRFRGTRSYQSTFLDD